MKRTCAVLMAVTVALGTATAGVAGATGGHRPDTRTLQRDADALLEQGAPGVLVELDTPRGEAKVRSGFGDVDARTPVPWNARFRIGSFTKTYVSATVLQLVGEGKLSLDDSVERWLPGVVSGNGNDGTRITVRHLLQHTSGLYEYLLDMPQLFDRDLFDQSRFESHRPEDLVALAMKHPPTFQPGEAGKWEYSNTNFQLAGMVIESVTGHSWQSEVRNRLVRPLGLRDTVLPGTSSSVPGPNAVGYQRFLVDETQPDREESWTEALDVTEYDPSWGGAAGDMISSTEDGNRFLRALVSGKVLRPAQLAEMQKTVPTDEGLQGAWPGARYGLGLLWVPNSCGGSWAHGGDIHGFKTRNGVSSDGSRSVVVSINTDSMVRKQGAPAPTKDQTVDLIEHALCGTR
jgi:D-alanyl-D-alanine carboxypeptidase